MTAPLPESDIREKDITEYRFFKELIARPYVEAVYMYGSRARGDFRPDSDFDLAVICPDATAEQWEEITRAVRYNDEMLVRVDLARLGDTSRKHFLGNVIRDRKLIYLRDFGGDQLTLEDKLDFMRNWDRKLTTWTENLNKNLAGNTPTQEQIKECFTSFQYAFDSAWVLWRKCLTLHGLRTNSPLSTFREAYMEGWIKDRPVWEAMTEDYFESKNADSTERRQLIYTRFPLYIRTLRETSVCIKELIRPYDYAHKK